MKIKLEWYILFYIFHTAFSDGNNYSRSKHSVPLDRPKQHNTSLQCERSLKLFGERLANSSPEDEDIWALQMMDATSKIPSGLLSYNFGEMGNFKQCIEIHSQRDNILGKYCLFNLKIDNSTFSKDTINIRSHMFLKSLLAKVSGGIQFVGNPTWALCVPSNCSANDVLRLINGTNALGFSVNSVSCQTYKDAHPALDRDAYIGISILSIIALLVFVSTGIDLYCLYTGKAKVRPFLVIFSVYTNGSRLFQIPNRTSSLSCLDGIKVISMIWIIILHTYSVYTSGPVFNSIDVVNFTNSLVSMIFINGDLACDTFLIVGGILVTYVYFRTEKKLTPRGVLEHYFHRYIRLTPALMGAVLVSATLLQYMGSGPKWNYIVKAFGGFCKKHWWSTLLYIQNEVNVNQMCVGHSWYLDVDMQLYIFSPAIFWILHNFPKVGMGILGSATLGSMSLCFAKAYLMNLSGITSTYYPKALSTTYMNEYYLKTETRAGPWLMGTVLGYMLTRRKYTQIKLQKEVVIPLWVLSLSVIVICVFGGHSTLRGYNYRALDNAFYIALVRPSFALAVGWVIWACATKHGGIINSFLSLPVFQFMNKFIYSMYLVHVTTLYMIVFSSKTSIYFSIFNMAYWFWGIFMLSFGLSIIWVLVFESPMLAIEKIIFSKSNSQNDRKISVIPTVIN